MWLELIQPVTEMITRNNPGGKERPVLKADNLTAICESRICGWLDVSQILWASTACYKYSFTFYFFNNKL
jgi:hypothetical protein